MSRADSGIVFTGSRADTPEPPDGEPAPSQLSIGATGSEQSAPTLAEESATVGGKVVSLSNGGSGRAGEGESAGEEDRLTVIPEEALGVGADEGISPGKFGCSVFNW